MEIKIKHLDQLPEKLHFKVKKLHVSWYASKTGL